MKIKIEKSEKTATIKEVVIKEATVQNIIDATRLAGTQEGAGFLAALMAQICTFDGRQLTYEDVTLLPSAFFFELAAALVTSGVLPSEEGLSTLSEKAGYPTKE